ncbi:hypothetical protein GCM10007047_33260 [Cerasicoccus arenae]|uniref:Uncharacterized protein n=1 Tax=Cerasicoccus arenae TaxID=424488 RepID=A0A8J3GGE2_9BACT|nr:hypothetical protein GCM10007047_33260 [Cerasicoccus arenae]
MEIGAGNLSACQIEGCTDIDKRIAAKDLTLVPYLEQLNELVTNVPHEQAPSVLCWLFKGQFSLSRR